MRVSIGPRWASSLRRKLGFASSLRALFIQGPNEQRLDDEGAEIMTLQPKTLQIETELTEIPGTEIKMSRVAIGTWAIGGWMWGGTDEEESISTIRAALDHGINLID